jgi:hypothetical protein
MAAVMLSESDAQWMLEKLEELAEKLDVRVRQETLGERDGDMLFRSGTCFFKGERLIILDGRLGLQKKCLALAAELKKMDLSLVFIPPRVRLFLEG